MKCENLLNRDMLKRKIDKYLIDWKNRDHNPLIVYGARQISLNIVLNNDNKVEYGIKFGDYNIGFNNNILTLPLFCIAFVDEIKIQ